MRLPVRLAFIAAALATLGGCVAVPVEPGYYEPAPVYYGPRVYYGPPVYYGPTIYFGIHGGRHGHRHR